MIEFSGLTGIPKDIFYECIAILITGAIGLILKSLWRLPILIQNVEESLGVLKKHVKDDEALHKEMKGQLTVHDRIFSRMLDEEIDSEKINLNGSYPKTKKYEV